MQNVLYANRDRILICVLLCHTIKWVLCYLIACHNMISVTYLKHLAPFPRPLALCIIKKTLYEDSLFSIAVKLSKSAEQTDTESNTSAMWPL